MGKTSEGTTDVQVGFEVCVGQYEHVVNLSSVASIYNGHTWLVVIFTWFRVMI